MGRIARGTHRGLMSARPTVWAARLGLIRVLGVALLVSWFAFWRPVWRLAHGIVDPSALPANISMCGRQWGVSDPPQVWTHAQAQAAGPVTVVVPGPFGYFTPCPWPGDALVSTVVLVRVDDDAYATYALRGGP